MPDIDIPFNFEPVSTTVETTTYNLAGSDYAKVTAVGLGADFIIDGGTVIPYSVPYGTGSRTSSGEFTLFTCPEGVTINGSLHLRQASTLGVNGRLRVRDSVGNAVIDLASGSTAWVTNNDVFMKPSWYLTIEANGSTQSFYEYYFSLTSEAYPQRSFWVSGGASGVTITGDKFIVELYNSIS